MTLRHIAQQLGLELLTQELAERLDTDVTEGHVSDLMSDALVSAPANGLWVTIHAHMNVVAVAARAALAGVVVASGQRPGEAVRARAVEKGIVLLSTPKTSFEVVAQLHELGIRAPR